MKRFTVADLIKRKQAGRSIKVLTAYDYTMAKALDQAGIDCILVGDSLAMVVLGYEDTTRVTLEDMIHHTKAVCRGTQQALVVGDLPFGSCHMGVERAVEHAVRLMREGGCKVVKLEGGTAMVPVVQAMVAAGIPVWGHLGYTPQSVNVFGGHKAQGKTLHAAQQLLHDALALEQAGACAIVLELVPHQLAKVVSERLTIPTIGIGAGAHCNGQVLVTQDMLGLFVDFSPKHVKKYLNLHQLIADAVQGYVNDIDQGVFPTAANSFELEGGVLEALDANS